MSIKLRISLLFAFIVTVILLLLNISIYYFASANRKDTFKKRLKNRALSTAEVFAASDDDNLPLVQRLDIAGLASLQDKTVIIFDFAGKPLYIYKDEDKDSLSIKAATLEKVKKQSEYFFTANDKEAVALSYVDSTKRFIVAVAALDEDGLDNLHRLKDILLISFVSGILIVLGVGYIFSQSLVRPISKMARQAGLISSSNLSSRIETDNAKDELHHLAASFNNLLDRLQESFQIQRRFISNASHELSTPLTSISSQLEVALQKERTTEEYKRVLISVHEDVLQLQQLTRSLLEIAKTGSHGSIDLNEVRVDEVLLKVTSDVKKQNPAYHLKLDFGEFPEDEKLLEVFGNSDLLYSSIRNLVENGCKYSEDNTAEVRIYFPDHQIKIDISSRGDVIAEADIQNIFEPFFRTGTALSKPGFGLGLTLAKRIIALHKGTIEVTSDPETGTVFTISLPSIVAFK